MPGLAANMTLLFGEVAPLDRPAAAARCGFDAVEVLFPYDDPPEVWRRSLEAAGVRLVLCDAPPGDWAAGDRGTAGIPGREAEFAEGLRRAVEVASALGAPAVNVLAGIVPSGVEAARCEATYASNLRLAGDVLGEAGVEVLVEPLNPIDVPGYLVTGLDQARRLLDEAGVGRLQLDLYHCGVRGEDPVAAIEASLGVLGHVQVGGVPGRHEPDVGTLPWERCFEVLDAAGWEGWVGAEYVPAGPTDEGLGWAHPWLRGQPA